MVVVVGGVEGGRGQQSERLQALLPSGGGKLRCRDVLGLGSGGGSCLNPEEGDENQGLRIKGNNTGSGWLSPGVRSVQWNVSCVTL